jgi:DNA-binding XRE family transcriptional regulator
MNHEEAKKLLFSEDKELENEYTKLEPIYEIKEQLIKLRIEKGLSQEELARIVGTRQSAISRLESGDYNPSMQFLYKVAKALGKDMHVVFN